LLAGSFTHALTCSTLSHAARVQGLAETLKLPITVGLKAGAVFQVTDSGQASMIG
jgi:hypothetical protein